MSIFSISAQRISAGQNVALATSAGIIRGQVVEVSRSAVLQWNQSRIAGTEANPAVKIRLYREVESPVTAQLTEYVLTDDYIVRSAAEVSVFDGELPRPKGQPVGNGVRNAKKSSRTPEIVIYSDIGGGPFGGYSAQDFHNDLSALPSNVESLTLRINSPGGDVFDGLAIAARISQLPYPVIGVVEGLCASIATAIAVSCTKIKMADSATFMIHKAFAMAMGTADDMIEMAERLRGVDQNLIAIYARKTRMSEAQLDSMMAKETWMNAEEALDYGFVDEVFESAKMAASAASMDRKWFYNRPASGSKPGI